LGVFWREVFARFKISLAPQYWQIKISPSIGSGAPQRGQSKLINSCWLSGMATSLNLYPTPTILIMTRSAQKVKWFPIDSQVFTRSVAAPARTRQMFLL
jgi:hypothetical protein